MLAKLLNRVAQYVKCRLAILLDGFSNSPADVILQAIIQIFMKSSILIASPIMPILLAPLPVILAPLFAMRFSVMFVLLFSYGQNCFLAKSSLASADRACNMTASHRGYALCLVEGIGRFLDAALSASFHSFHLRFSLGKEL